MSDVNERTSEIQVETMHIAVSLICQVPSSNVNYLRIKKQVDRLIHRHELLFTGMLRKLDSLSISTHANETNRQDNMDNRLCLDLIRIFDQLIQDDHITWGKIITIFAFSTFIARKYTDIDERIASITGQYVTRKLLVWIDEHGGWVRSVDVIVDACQQQIISIMMMDVV
jgi:hypothetical protein